MTPASLLQAAVAGVLGAAATPAGVAGDLWAAAPPAAVTFHLMQIEQVIGGVNGDAAVQAIQLRMRSSFQQFVAGARLRAWDAQGQNPVLLTDFGSNVPVGGAGRRVLITTANFSGFLDGPLAPNFIMANPIPASYFAAGSITFESDTGTIWWRLSWGGAGYTGSTLGAGGLGGNDADGDFGRWPGVLPSSGVQALRFQGSAGALSTNNANDYALTAGPATFTNNAGHTAAVLVPTVVFVDDDNCPGPGDGSELDPYCSIGCGKSTFGRTWRSGSEGTSANRLITPSPLESHKIRWIEVGRVNITSYGRIATLLSQRPNGVPYRRGDNRRLDEWRIPRPTVFLRLAW